MYKLKRQGVPRERIPSTVREDVAAHVRLVRSKLKDQGMSKLFGSGGAMDANSVDVVYDKQRSVHDLA